MVTIFTPTFNRKKEMTVVYESLLSQTVLPFSIYLQPFAEIDQNEEQIPKVETEGGIFRCKQCKSYINSKYVIKDMGIEIKLESKTKNLIINDNKIMVEYDLFMNGEFSDSFKYEVEWSDL